MGRREPERALHERRVLVRRARTVAVWVLPIVAISLVLGDYYRIPWLSVALSAVLALCIFVDGALLASEGLSWLDCGVAIIAAYEIVCYLMSQYRPNSLYSASSLFFAAGIYFLIRCSVRFRIQALLQAGILAAFGVWISVPALMRFSASLDQLHAAGFTEIVPFREKLTLGSRFVAGEWFTVVLLTAPYAILLIAAAFSSGRRVLGFLAVLPAGIIALELAATCSRAVFSAFVVGVASIAVIAMAYRLITLNRGVLVLASTLVGLGCVLLIGQLAFPGLASCYTQRDTSQARSAEGRVAIWRSALDATHGSRVWGVGSGNSGFLLASHADDGVDSAFAARTFSLPVEILVEKGVVGAVCYGLLILAILLELHFTLRSTTLDASTRWIALVAFAGIVMGLFRDLTYSSLTAHRVTLALLFSLLGLLASTQQIRVVEAVPAKAIHQKRGRR